MTDTTHDPSGRRVAILALNGVEEAELERPHRAVTGAGGTAHILSAEEGSLTALVGDWDRGRDFPVDGPIAGASADDYDALLIPGGTLSADALRIDADAVRLTQQFASAGKPILSICHGPWVLLEAGLVDGLRLTSYVSVRTDLENAGARWVDEELVTDRGITTSRNPGDLDAFCAALLEQTAGS